jgi:hypothetical protein
LWKCSVSCFLFFILLLIFDIFVFISFMCKYLFFDYNSCHFKSNFFWIIFVKYTNGLKQDSQNRIRLPMPWGLTLCLIDMIYIIAHNKSLTMCFLKIISNMDVCLFLIKIRPSSMISFVSKARILQMDKPSTFEWI